MTLPAFRTRPAAAIAGVALLTALTAMLFVATAHRAATAAAPREVIVVPASSAPVVIEHMTVIVPESLDPHMAIAHAWSLDRGIAAPMPRLALRCVPPGPRGVCEAVAAPILPLWTTLVADGAPLWFANLADDVISGLVATPTLPTT